ncbi:AcrR family transcriptional regulator [Streptosporangium becharense]|uniref:AcrR family transcriptional regulator n=1 Tax=Streptosporangium becharense TaxID=1816182 RepID=A0A7W9IBQ3_9ACTN|nr:TetR/AcrR family transcriptional regulator [Streptosporangium becharense]MBB2914166.1 AcrR family transcriptional regulator [Streptosporangium becharense]MBB5817193.1 AcrR family transcriptional regulator [Streptosporangium becharense]
MILSTTERKGDARERLLARLLDAFDEALPSPEVSLREIAARTETSHALLRYHFGSLSGVLAAMLKAQRSRDNEALFAAAQQGTFANFVVAIWRTYTRPEQLSRVRGFFHVAGLAAYRPEDFREFIDSLDDLTKMLASLAEREGHDTGEALTMATVAIAAIRGLLLQEVLTPGVHSENAVDLILRMLPGNATGVHSGDGVRPHHQAGRPAP